MAFRRSVLSITVNSETFDVIKEGKDLRLCIRAGDLTISKLPPCFQAPKWKRFKFKTFFILC